MVPDSYFVEILARQLQAEYPLFAAYSLLLQQGRRKEALVILGQFLQSARHWNAAERKTFCQSLFTLTADTTLAEGVLTTPIREQIIEPALRQMMADDPADYRPQKWYGILFRHLGHLRQAYALYPNDARLNRALLQQLDYALWTSTHHLPETYLGEQEADQANLQFAFSILSTLPPAAQEPFRSRFVDYQRSIEEHLRTSAEK